jgi:hypothetical protein
MKKSDIFGCLVPSVVVAILGILSLVFIVHAIFSEEEPESIPIENAEYPDAESLRSLSGLTIIPDVTYAEGTRYHESVFSLGGKEYIYHYADSVIAPKDKRTILRRAKTGKEYFWLYGEEAYSNAFAIYKGYNIATDETYEIFFCDSIIRLSFNPAVGFIENEVDMAKELGIPAFPKYELLNFYSMFGPPMMDGEKVFALQLEESPQQLQQMLLDAGYVLSNEEGEDGYLLEKKSSEGYVQSYKFVSFPSPNHVKISFNYL